MKYLPIFLNLSNKYCLVVGAGGAEGTFADDITVTDGSLSQYFDIEEIPV